MTILNKLTAIKNKFTLSFLAISTIILFIFSNFNFNNDILNTK